MYFLAAKHFTYLEPEVKNISKSYMYLLVIKHLSYIDSWCKTSTNVVLSPVIKLSLQNKIQSTRLEYDDIINKLIELKKVKTEFIISKYNECLKYLNYAEEECSSQEKLLLSLAKINKYDIKLDNLITNIIMLPIQKHTFCISTFTNIDIIVSEIFEHKNVIKETYNDAHISLFKYLYGCFFNSEQNGEIFIGNYIYHNN